MTATRTVTCSVCGKTYPVEPPLDYGDTIRCECGAEFEITGLDGEEALKEIPEDEEPPLGV